MLQKLKRYQKDFDFSYCLGVFPTLELIQTRPETILAILLHSKGEHNQGIDKIRLLAGNLQIEIIENDRLVEKLASRGNTYAIGVFKKFQAGLDPTQNQLVLVNPSSMGNLGTIMRSMLGFGIKDLALIEPAADPFDPKVIRGSMGAVFQIRFQKFRSFPDYWGMQTKQSIYPFMTDGKIALPEVSFSTPAALVFGGEAPGLGEEFHQFGTSVRIPQAEEVDSLNLAQSVGIALYQFWVKNNP
jgi:TrmH family RNA methyltransferase